MENLETDQITTEGDIKKMKFLITHQEDRIDNDKNQQHRLQIYYKI